MCKKSENNGDKRLRVDREKWAEDGELKDHRGDWTDPMI